MTHFNNITLSTFSTTYTSNSLTTLFITDENDVRIVNKNTKAIKVLKQHVS